MSPNEFATDRFSDRLRIAICIALLTAMAIFSSSTTIGATGDKVVFRVTKRLSAVVAHIAIAEGFFEEEGLAIQIVPTDSSTLLIPAMARGKVDVSMTGQFDAAYINIIQRGARVRLVAARTAHTTDDCSYFSFAARSELIDSGRLTAPSSLRGLRIATDRTAGSYYYWSLLLASGGLTFDDVEIVDVPTAAKPEAMAKGLVDVVSQSEPWTSRIVSTGKARIWRPVSDVLPNHQSSFLVFGRRLLDERPDLGQRFMSAYMRAVWQYAKEGKSERNIEIVANQTRMNRDELREMCWPQPVIDAQIDDRSLQQYQEWALAEGLIDAIVPREQLVDDRFLPRPGDTMKEVAAR